MTPHTRDSSTLSAQESNSEESSTSENQGSLACARAFLRPGESNIRARSLLSFSLSTSCLRRPSVESLIRPAVETVHGDTAVVVCGGVSLTAQTKTFVSALSDKRAVQKGSGAQGMFLFTETYGL